MISDYLNIERALSGVLAFEELGPDQRDFCIKYQDAFDIGRLAGRMARDYYAYKAAITIARDPRANSLVSTELRGNKAIPVGDVARKDGRPRL